MTIDRYLDMQRKTYREEAVNWSLDNKDPVVGSYDAHNSWQDYDDYLFKNVETKDKVALEYGCGPARNIIKFWNRFARIDGVDISIEVLAKASHNLAHNNILTDIFYCDGKSIPKQDNSYDIVFSTICLQHIACYDIRFSILKESYRVLKPNGYLCFQMGFNGKDSYHGRLADYHENITDALTTNGGCDVLFNNEQYMIDDLTNIGFKNYSSDIRPVGPGDTHKNWIFIRASK